MKKLLYLLLLALPCIAVAQEKFSVYFDTNKHELTPTESKKLSEWMVANKRSKILIISGYTDEDGTNAHNDTLSQRRVMHVYNAVKNTVRTRDDFKTRSFGEAHNMSANKAENRRVTLYYLPQNELHRENEVLGIKEEVKKKKPVVYRDKIVINDPRRGRQEIPLDVEFMKKVGEAAPGEKLEIKNMNFILNTYAITDESRPRLFELLEIMRVHPQLKIKLLGHICCIEGDPRKLSYDRAKAVAMFLRQNGVEKERVSFEGLGTTQPLYPLPESTEEQRAANRRVEVLVVENP